MNEATAKSSRYDYMVEPFQEDYTARLSWSVLGNRILAAAGMHADSHGFGLKQLAPQNYAWVLSRLVIEMDEMPRAGESYSIETWIRAIYRTFTDRCFAILRPDGTAYGYVYSVWALIDTETRQPVNLEHLPDGGFAAFADESKPCPVAPFSRIRVKGDCAKQSRTALYSDIDINNHVNSIRYIEHVLDLFPKQLYAVHPVRRIEMAYHSESYADEQLHFYYQNVAELTNIAEVRKTVEQPAAPDGTASPAKEQIVCACRVDFK